MGHPIILSFTCFGKTTTIKKNGGVMHIDDMFDMFRTIVISEFGEKKWEEMILLYGDRIVEGIPTTEKIPNTFWEIL
jgi:hypothetical protein